MSSFSWPSVLARLIAREDLTEEESGAVMREVMSGAATPAQVAGFLVAMRAKGESVGEIVGLARTMREFSKKVEVPGPLIDTCGTGGDRAGTVNISTMAAFVVAGAGGRVAKHGNRAASSRCGSADLLEALGVAIDLEPPGVAACIEESGMGFCFAMVFHPAMRHAGVPRRELGIPTVFNFLGPLTNPAGATRQTVGVSDPMMAPKIAEALGRLGTERATVFRGDDGLDELTTTTASTLWQVQGGAVAQERFDPATVGISPASTADLAGADPAANAERCMHVLAGGHGAVRDAVCLNAAAALVVGGLAPDLVGGLQRARESVDSGLALRVLERLRDVSTSLKS